MTSAQPNLAFSDFSTWEFLFRDVLENGVGYLDFLKKVHELFFEILGTDQLPRPLFECTSAFLRETMPETITLLLWIGSMDANAVEAIIISLEVVVLCIWATSRRSSTNSRACTAPASPIFPTRARVSPSPA
jgi:hypothetical protein